MIRKGCPDEYPIPLVLNGYEIAIFQLTKYDLEDWTYGYLFSEGFIQDADDIETIQINEETGAIHVALRTDFDAEELFSTKKKHLQQAADEGSRFFL